MKAPAMVQPIGELLHAAAAEPPLYALG